MDYVKSAYNFVPAPDNDQVYTPSWAKDIDELPLHVIPQKDALSGEIEISITAETPIFIKEGISKEEAENKKNAGLAFEFEHYVNKNGDKQYFIPATSLKGLIRNTVEIISFSRLNPKLVNNNRFSFRDLSASKENEYLKAYDSNNVKAGWMSLDDDGNWIIEECRLRKIHHKDVDLILKTNFREQFLNNVPKPKERSAKYKYNSAAIKSLESTFDIDGPKAVFKENGVKGTIVFTGQASARKESEGKKGSGKVNEFVFLEGIINIYKLEEKDILDFKFIYNDHDKFNISEDWKFWREKLEEGKRIPVFFNANNGKVLHFGLSFMYKLPYKYSIHEMQPISSYSKSEIDFSNLLMGFTDNKNGLKGRVYFSNALAESPISEGEKMEILASPKASFIPFYIEQKNNSLISYQTLGKLKGFKKYPVRKEVQTTQYTSEQLNNKLIFSKFKPLSKNSVFKAKIRYFNLNKEELGAIVSALSFHNNENTFFHSLGTAKGLGFGAVKIQVKDIEQYINSMQHFELLMNQHLSDSAKAPKLWINSSPVKELFSISAMPQNDECQNSLVYPKLKNSEGKNDFIAMKTSNLSLNQYSKINAIESLKPLIDNDFIDQINKVKIQLEQEIKQAKDKMMAEYTANIQAAHELLLKHEYDIARKTYEEAIMIYNDGTLNHFLDKIEETKKNKIEQDAFELIVASKSIDELSNFLNSFPNSKYKDDVAQKISKLKATSGFPSRLMMLTEADKFFKESEQWINKLPNRSILDSGFENQLIERVLYFYNLNGSSKRKDKNWENGVYKRKILNWFGEKLPIELSNV